MRVTDHVLVGIHKYVKAVLSRHPQNFKSMLDPFFVVFAWTGPFYSFPCKDVPDRIVAPAF